MYQLGGRLFFNAYCPLTSTYRHASLLLSEVSMLLSPSSFQTQHDVHWNEPPSAYHLQHACGNRHHSSCGNRRALCYRVVGC